MTSSPQPPAPNAYRELRQLTSLTQGELALLLGVHPVTLSQWERGQSEPDPWHHGLLLAFAQAAMSSPDAPKRACRLLHTRGLGAALFELLRAAYLPPLQPTAPTQNSPDPRST
jgi:transcriptional regulator with XRE-family HTH domain